MGLSDYNGWTGKEREKSLRQVHKLWNSGEVPRPQKCLACGQTEGAIHGHSEDYSNDDVHIPICITCHLLLHGRFQKPKLWEDYKLGVRHGFMGPPLEQKNALWEIQKLYPGLLFEDRWYTGERVSASVLDMICPIKFIHPNSPMARETPPCLEDQ